MLFSSVVQVFINKHIKMNGRAWIITDGKHTKGLEHTILKQLH